MPNGEEGPFWDPIACSSRQGIAPEFGQLGSVPAVIIASLLPQTTLLSKELCHVGLPKGSAFGANPLGLVSGLRKWVRICWLKLPNQVTNKVACGLAELTVHEAPEPNGKQTWPCVPVACPMRTAVFPAGGVMLGGV